MVRANLRPSRLIAVALSAVHAGAAATLLPLDLPMPLRIAGVVAIVANLAHALWRHWLLRGRRAIVMIEIIDQRNGAICGRDGIWHDAKVLGTTYVTPALTVINVRRPGARLASHVLLTIDNVPAEDFRKIRVLLRWAHPKRALPGAPEALQAELDA